MRSAVDDTAAKEGPQTFEIIVGAVCVRDKKRRATMITSQSNIRHAP
jgi:hypothetical protein